MFPTRYSAIVATGLLTIAAACTDQQPTLLGLEDENVGATDGAPIFSFPGQVIPGAYIVLLKEREGSAAINAASADRTAELPDRSDAAAVAENAGATPRQLFDSINGFAAALSAAQLEAVRQDPRVAYVEPDQIVTSATTQSTSV